MYCMAELWIKTLFEYNFLLGGGGGEKAGEGANTNNMYAEILLSCVSAKLITLLFKMLISVGRSI